jgi:heat shock protein HslJ
VRHHAALFISVGLALASVGCGDNADGVSASGESLNGTSWTLVSVPAGSHQVPAVRTAALSFDSDGKSLSGSTGCNQFSGTFEQSGSGLTIKVGSTTLAACADVAAGAQEAAILAQLPNVKTFSSVGGKLQLKHGSGDTLFNYDAALSSLKSTTWTATGVNNGKGAVQASSLTETITAQFGDDGTLSGFAGCNNYNATYEQSGTSALSITAVSSTLKACSDDVMQVESDYLAALPRVVTYSITGDVLRLADAGGSAQVTYTLAS